MDFLHELAQNAEFPIAAAFALGLLTAIAPCPLATNITATAYIAKNLSSRRRVILDGVLYTLGRVVSYTSLGLIIFFGASKFRIASIFQGNGEKFLGFLLVIIGLFMVGLIKLNFIKGWSLPGKIAEKFKGRGSGGAFLMGILFALAFCPYSGVLFFAMLIPMTLSSASGPVLPVFYAIGTGLPVLLFAMLLAFSAEKVGYYFNAIAKVEKIMRLLAGIVFILTGLYYINIFYSII